MNVSLLQWKLCRRGYHWPLLAVASAGPLILMQTSFATKLHSHHVCAVCNHRWSKQPAMVGSPLAALGFSLDGGVLYVSKVPVTAGEPDMVSGLT